MRLASPTLEPISSAANSTTNACARPMRMPEKSCGAAAGMMTRKKIVRGGVPMFCAAQTRSGLTDSTAWRDAMKTGKKHREGDDADLGCVPEAEQQQKDRQERDLREWNRETTPADRRNAARRARCRRRARRRCRPPVPRANPSGDAIEARRQRRPAVRRRRRSSHSAATISVGTER